MRLNPPPDATPGLRRRFIVVSVAAAVIFGVLLLRLWYLQIINVDQYRNLSERNRTRFIHIDAPRGIMYDRNGVMLVDSRPAFTVSVLRQEISDRKQLFNKLGLLLHLDPKVFEARWRAGQTVPDYQPLPLLEDIDRATMEIVQEHGLELPGVIVEGKPLRAYPYGQLGAHLLGYLGEITDEDLKRPELANYRAGGLIGNFTHAVSGGSLYRKTSFLVDSLGQPVMADHLDVDAWRLCPVYTDWATAEAMLSVSVTSSSTTCASPPCPSISARRVLSFSLSRTPKRCSSSTMTRPRSRKETSVASSRWVPTRTSTLPAAASARMARPSSAVFIREMASTRTG